VADEKSLGADPLPKAPGKQKIVLCRDMRAVSPVMDIAKEFLRFALAFMPRDGRGTVPVHIESVPVPRAVLFKEPRLERVWLDTAHIKPHPQSLPVRIVQGLYHLLMIPGLPIVGVGIAVAAAQVHPFHVQDEHGGIHGRHFVYLRGSRIPMFQVEPIHPMENSLSHHIAFRGPVTPRAAPEGKGVRVFKRAFNDSGVLTQSPAKPAAPLPRKFGLSRNRSFVFHKDFDLIGKTLVRVGAECNSCGGKAVPLLGDVLVPKTG